MNNTIIQLHYNYTTLENVTRDVKLRVLIVKSINNNNSNDL